MALPVRFLLSERNVLWARPTFSSHLQFGVGQIGRLKPGVGPGRGRRVSASPYPSPGLNQFTPVPWKRCLWAAHLLTGKRSFDPALCWFMESRILIERVNQEVCVGRDHRRSASLILRMVSSSSSSSAKAKAWVRSTWSEPAAYVFCTNLVPELLAFSCLGLPCVPRSAADVKVIAARQALAKELDAIRAEDPGTIKHDYAFSVGQKNPFHVTAIYHDDRFTYIEAAPEEAPSVYGVKDGKPSLIQYTFKDGRYTIPKILDDGYLRVGKSDLKFHSHTAG
jgi:hypothetical protein